MNPTCSRCAVLLAAFNGIKYLDEQIRSILDQSMVNLTIFISLDLSNDGSERWLRQLADREPRIIFLPYGERFGCAAKNFFRLIRDVDFSSYDYVAFADQDDIWNTNKLE